MFLWIPRNWISYIVRKDFLINWFSQSVWVWVGGMKFDMKHSSIIALSGWNVYISSSLSKRKNNVSRALYNLLGV
jgi:hypothetical protein